VKERKNIKKFKGHNNFSVGAGNRNRNSDLRLRLAGAGAERNILQLATLVYAMIDVRTSAE
jgi:hypothetical protein